MLLPTANPAPAARIPVNTPPPLPLGGVGAVFTAPLDPLALDLFEEEWRRRWIAEVEVFLETKEGIKRASVVTEDDGKIIFQGGVSKLEIF